jgi:hypothetical protein
MLPEVPREWPAHVPKPAIIGNGRRVLSPRVPQGAQRAAQWRRTTTREYTEADIPVCRAIEAQLIREAEREAELRHARAMATARGAK